MAGPYFGPVGDGLRGLNKERLTRRASSVLRVKNKTMKTIKASIIGVTGYTGLELLRLLIAHPHVEIAHLTSRQHEDEPVGAVYPHLSHMDLKISNTAPATVAQDSDVVFLCLPHKTAQDTVAELHGHVKVIDLSADYRLDDVQTYESYYNVPHNYPDLLKQVVYGLPEIVGTEAVKNAETVANPGCFAALAQLMLFPFKNHIQQADIMAVTGSSGAGKTATNGTHHPIRSHNIKSYNINLHRHIPEITRTAGITKEQLNFVPTSGPFVRGIFATAFVTLNKNAALSCAANIYEHSPFIRVQDTVELAHIVGSNFCDLSYTKVSDDTVIVQGALDNLVKGAAGTAVQNMNLMFGLKETDGLINLGTLYP